MGAVSVLLDDQPCLNPSLLFDEATRLGWDVSHWYGKANSFHLPSGRTPGYGWILLTRKQVAKLQTDSKIDIDHTLTFSDGTNSAVLQKIQIVSCRALYGNKISTPSDETAYLVELADIRRLAQLSYTDRHYNIRMPNPSAISGQGLYYTGSTDTDNSAPWTWELMIEKAWRDISPLASGGLYSSPTLPYTPNGTPENFSFRGGNAWEALNLILDACSCVLIYDPILDAFSFQRTGVTQSGLSSAWSNLSTRFWSDQCAIPCIRSNIPETIKVCFHKQSKFFGTEAETGQNTVFNWIDDSGPYVIQKSTSIAGATPNGILTVYDSMPAIMVKQHDTTPDNDTDLQARATEVANNLKATLQTSDTYLSRQIIGIVGNILPGSEIKLVSWLDIGSGLVTEFQRYPSPCLVTSPDAPRLAELAGYHVNPSPQSNAASPYFSSRENRGSGLGYFGPRDQSTPRYLDYPTKLQIVKVTSTDPNTDGLFSGIVETFPTDAPTSGLYTYVEHENCWVIPLQDNRAGTYDKFSQATLENGKFYLARLVSWATFSGTTKPVYVVDAMRTLYTGTTQSNWKKSDGSHTDAYVPVKISGSAVTIDVRLPVYNYGCPNIGSGKRIDFYKAFDIPSSGDQAICISPYLDDAIGTIKLFAAGSGPGTGWGLADGTANAVANGGSGLNLLAAYLYMNNGFHATENKSLAGALDLPTATLTPYERLDNSV